MSSRRYSRAIAWLTCLVMFLSCSDPASPPAGIPERPILFAARENPYLTGQVGMSAIYAVQADGSGLRLITRGAGQARAPSWSRDGMRVAFASGVEEAFSAYEIWLMNADGSDAHAASSSFPTCGNGYTSLTWAPAGDRLGAECWADISIFDLRTGESYSLSDRLGARTSTPDWSPDGKHLAISGPGSGEVSIVNPDGTGLAPLLSNAADAAWSPDGKRLGFFAVEGWHASILVANSDGSGRSRVTPDSLGPLGGPAWSPDGKWLVFHDESPLCSDVGSPPSEYCYLHESLYVVRADGTGLRQITPDTLEAVQPAW